MMRIFALVTLFACAPTHAQQVLHFTRTSGYDHQTRTVSYAMFQGVASDLGIIVTDDATGDPFTDPSTLAEYDVIVFSNTSGNAILDAQQRTNFELWVEGGGRVMGIHAATDTYRHSSANGNNTGTWDYYAELIGASVQENPNHVSGTPAYAMDHITSHASTANLPDPWVKNEEYYYWENGYFGTDNTEVLRVVETVGPNGQVNSYDAPRPMSWYRILPNGSRIFYTALGHAQENYTSDTLFRAHIRDALAWLLDGVSGTQDTWAQLEFSIYPNPGTGPFQLTADDTLTGETIIVHDITGRTAFVTTVVGRHTSLSLESLVPGLWYVRIGTAVQPLMMVH